MLSSWGGATGAAVCEEPLLGIDVRLLLRDIGIDAAMRSSATLSSVVDAFDGLALIQAINSRALLSESCASSYTDVRAAHVELDRCEDAPSGCTCRGSSSRDGLLRHIAACEAEFFSSWGAATGAAACEEPLLDIEV